MQFEFLVADVRKKMGPMGLHVTFLEIGASNSNCLALLSFGTGGGLVSSLNYLEDRTYSRYFLNAEGKPARESVRGVSLNRKPEILEVTRL